jgi:hypothetical protein
MMIIEGAVYGLLFSLLYQLGTAYQYNQKNHKWPWQNNKNHLALGFFLIGFLFKMIITAILGVMMVLFSRHGSW